MKCKTERESILRFLQIRRKMQFREYSHWFYRCFKIVPMLWEENDEVFKAFISVMLWLLYNCIYSIDMVLTYYLTIMILDIPLKL